MLCPDCNGQGYTEHEGTIEDMELAQAVEKLFETGSHHVIQTYKGCRQAYFYDKKMLIEWYRDQKVAQNDTRTENAATPEKCE